MQLTRYELRMYDSNGKLIAYVPFETQQQAIDYFITDDEMNSDDWALYFVILTPNSDHAEFLRRLTK